MVSKERGEWRFRGKCRNHNIRFDQVDCERFRSGSGCGCKFMFTLSRTSGLTFKNSHDPACKVLYPTMDSYYSSKEWALNKLKKHKDGIISATTDAVRGGVYNKKALKNIAVMEVQKRFGADVDIPDDFIFHAVEKGSQRFPLSLANKISQ